MGHSASQRPERRKTESELGKRGQRPSARAPRRQRGRSRDAGSAHPASRVGILADPRPRGLPPTHAARALAHLWASPPRLRHVWVPGPPTLFLPSPPEIQELLPGPKPHLFQGEKGSRYYQIYNDPSPTTISVLPQRDVPHPTPGGARQADVDFPVPSFLASALGKVLSV